MLLFLEDIAREFPEPLQPIRQLLTVLGVLNEQLDVIGIKVQKTQQLLNLLLLLLILPPPSHAGVHPRARGLFCLAEEQSPAAG